ncbi:MAG TPA: dipeptidase [Sphingomonadales bacterium]|nr:dipeptidase [Sphingomonadales bacterium]
MRILSLVFIGFLAVGLSACGQETPSAAEKARALAQAAIIVDTHVDLPYRLEEGGWEDVSVPTLKGDFDYPRAREGGLNAPFMSIYTPADLGDGAEATANAERLIDLMEKVVASAPDKFALAYSPDEVEHNFAAGLISLPLGMENGSPIAGELANLQHFYDRGIRYITLTHSKSNHISDSSYDANKQWGGLSPFGEEVVREMNRLGIMVDISHVSDEAFWDALAISEAPLIASHSSLRHFTPGLERNMSDEMVKALAGKGGIIMINFGSFFLTEAAHQAGEAYDGAYEAYRAGRGLDDTPEAKAAFEAEFYGEAGYPYATLEDVLDHFDRAIEVAGVDHVGIGSDFDGVEDTLPIGLKDVSQYPNLIEGLLRRGHSEEDVRKILSGNILRVWREVEAAAARLQASEEIP